ncbi:CvpA family protein [Scatolibacter rhodanostii]|uniref:CvpA family protein n=1 Tax=Scatolibacter rhodanostii TaxID=2014781 RepID=UPI000C0839C0|nr:CvpA family protein [Scatolibacter rhodanostii]
MFLDIILVVIFILCIVWGVRKGLVHSALRFIGTVVAASCSGLLGGMAAQWIYDTFFRPAIVQKVNEGLAEAAAEEKMYQVFEGFPEFIIRALEKLGVTQESLSNQMTTQVDKAAETVAQAFAPIMVGLLKVMTVLVIFMLLMIVVRVLVNSISAVFKFPVLREVNGALGGIFNLLTALVFAWAIFSLFQMVLPMLTLEMQAEIQKVTNESKIAQMFFSFNPFRNLFAL